MNALHRSSTHDADRHWKIPGDHDTEYYEYTKQYIGDFDKSGTLTFHRRHPGSVVQARADPDQDLAYPPGTQETQQVAGPNSPSTTARRSTQIERKAVRNRQKLERDKEWIEAEHQAVLRLHQAVDELAAKEQEAEELVLSGLPPNESNSHSAKQHGLQAKQHAATKGKSSRLARPDARTLKPRRMPSWMP